MLNFSNLSNFFLNLFKFISTYVVTFLVNDRLCSTQRPLVSFPLISILHYLHYALHQSSGSPTTSSLDCSLLPVTIQCLHHYSYGHPILPTLTFVISSSACELFYLQLPNETPTPFQYLLTTLMQMMSLVFLIRF